MIWPGSGSAGALGSNFVFSAMAGQWPTFTAQQWEMVKAVAEETMTTPEGVLEGLIQVVFGKSWKEKQIDDNCGSMIVAAGKHKNRKFMEVVEDEEYVRWLLSKGSAKVIKDESLEDLREYVGLKFELVMARGKGRGVLIPKEMIGPEGEEFERILRRMVVSDARFG